MTCQIDIPCGSSKSIFLRRNTIKVNDSQQNHNSYNTIFRAIMTRQGPPQKSVPVAFNRHHE